MTRERYQVLKETKNFKNDTEKIEFEIQQRMLFDGVPFVEEIMKGFENA